MENDLDSYFDDFEQGCPDMCIHGYSGYKDSGIRADTGLDTNFCQNGLDTNIFQSGYRIPDWIQIFAQMDTGYRIGYTKYFKT